MSHWEQLKHLAQKHPIATMCTVDATGHPHMCLMHILESSILGRFIISISTSSSKLSDINTNNKSTWYIGSLLGEHAELSGEVSVLTYKPENEAVFKEVWSEVLAKYEQKQMSTERVLLVMNAKTVKITTQEMKVTEVKVK
ncbi:Conserved_hypothetical protein [Hexamita inflata]|uniref:Pyridoxamine 5'-phosphate oxidase N-terminal domain-containing protein n=1 Tax=Hexamita inflata TaxID=28002 RepID=A0AA86TJ05_9EUKA|nr:Conserved hypothetical protein [Hexamita inflata]